MITKPFTFEGKELSLNFATSAAGGVRVELQSPDGKVIPGYSADECQEVIGNELDRRVAWKSGTSLAALARIPIRMRYILKDADVYSMKFMP